MKSRRMVHLVHERIGAVGGIQRFDLRVLRALALIAAERGLELEVLALNGIMPGTQLPEGVRIVSAHGSRARLLWLLLTRHWGGRLDLVFVAHLRLQKTIWPARLLYFRSRYVLFVHGIEAWSAGRTRSNRLAARAIVRFSVDDIVSVSQFTADRVRAAFALQRQRVHLLPNALDLSPAMASAPVAGAAPGHPTVLTVARMDPHDLPKGIAVALRAVAQLTHEFPELRYRVVGDGVLRTRHESLAASLGLSPHVEFLGRVDEGALEAIYDDADVFLLPSSKEGFGIVFLEAWRHALPVVCGNVDASTEVVEDGVDGFAVDPTDSDAVARAVRRLLEDRALRQHFGTQGRNKLLLKYSGPIFVETLRRIVAGNANTQPALGSLPDEAR